MIELVIVTTLLGVLSLSALSSLKAFKDNSEATICEVNRRQLELIYQTELLVQPELDSTTFILKYSKEIFCPRGGGYSLLNDRVTCSLHEDKSSYHIE